MKRFCFLLLCSISLFAQNGDNAGESQLAPQFPGKIPDAPALTVEQALKSFHLQPGFRIEAVASDPMIESPVEIEFDPDGRMYVLEMRGFMRGVDGAGEDQPLGRVSLLEDTDGDGRMDRSTIFADQLVMPRAIAFVRGGLLVAEPPHLWFFHDENGDGKADKKEEVSNDYGNQANPEHTANGLMWGRDNWIYSANHTVRYRNIRGYWEKDVTQFRGQWGITQDDYGRLFFNSNSDQFRGDLVAGQYFMRNPNFKSPYGVNVQIARDQATFPGRVNPGVNRGYQKGTLRADGTLAQYTGACSPCIYRGGLFPSKFYGAGFLCEPTGNLIRCNLLIEKDGVITATNAFPNAEFLTSVDERFRPVNLVNGPDGALYVVDLYRGVIQHKIYLTTYLRNQALSRGLEGPWNQGRIYRIIPEGTPRPGITKLSKLESTQLVQALSATNGWTRDTAQQLLVERNDFQSYDALNELASKGEFPGSIHALWVLNAVGELNPEPILGALRSTDPKVRATAVRIAEPFLRAEGKNEISEKILALTNDPSFDVKLQLMFSLGESKSGELAMIDLLDRNVDSRLMRDAAVSGVKGREFAFVEKLLSRWEESNAGREALIRELAGCVAESRDASAISQLLDASAAMTKRWQQYALIDGINSIVPKGKKSTPAKPLRLSKEPAAFAKLQSQSEAGLEGRLGTLTNLVVWPGKPGYDEPHITPLTVEEHQRFEAGKAQFLIICGACHQPTGLGLEGLAPPLVDSDWVNGSPERVARIVLNGVRGKLNVKGRTWELEMPPLNILSDQDIANLLTYVRRDWGHTASPVTADFIAKVRADTAKRESAWTEPELLRIK